jgi:hypothetical protein
MLEGKDRTPETCWIIAAVEDPIMEVGRDSNGFHSGVTSNSIWFHLGHSGSLDKGCYFILVKIAYSGAKVAEFYMSKIVCLHDVPNKIVSDRGTKFTSKF